MRVRIDRDAGALHLAVSEALEARRVTVAEGVAVAYDAAGRILGVELRGVDAAGLHDFTVELAGLADRPAGVPSVAAPHSAAPPRPVPAPPPEPFAGTLAWDPEAEAAVLAMPFFSRGRVRLAASALARKRGLDRVGLKIVQAVAR